MSALNPPIRLSRLIWLAALAGCCATALHTRVYLNFERVRIRVVTSELQPSDGALRVALPDVSDIVGSATSIVLNVENADRTDTAVTVMANGDELGSRVLGAGQTTRVDLALPEGFPRADGNTIEVRSSAALWSLHLLEVGNAYGFSHGWLSFVVVPNEADDYGSVPAWVSLGVFGVVWLMSVPWFQRMGNTPLRITHRVLTSVVLLVLAAVLVLPLVSRYKVLLSIQTFWICTVVLYAPVVVALVARGWGAVVSRPWAMRQVWSQARIPVLYGMTVGIFAVSVLGFYDARTGFTTLIRFGSQFDSQALPTLRAVPHEIDKSPGYDGQFYAQLALDPLTRDPAIERALDNFPYRARRILFAWTAFGLGLGQPEWILQAYAVQNVLCWLALAFLLLRWFPPLDGKHFFGWFAVLFSHGLIASIEASLLEGPSLLLLVLAIIALEGRRRWVSVFVIGLAGLGRETNVLFVPALLDRLPRAWRPRLALGAQVVAVGLPLACWLVYLRLSHADVSFDMGGGAFAAPLSGYVGDWRVAIGQLRQEGWSSFARFDLLALTSLTTQLVFFAVRREWASPWYRVAIVYSVLLAFLGPAVWEGTPGAFTRVLLPMTCAYNILLPHNRGYWPLAVLGNLTVLNGLAALRTPLIWSYL